MMVAEDTKDDTIIDIKEPSSTSLPKQVQFNLNLEKPSKSKSFKLESAIEEVSNDDDAFCSTFKSEELQCSLLRCSADSKRVQKLALNHYEVYGTSNSLSPYLLLAIRSVLFLLMGGTFVRSYFFTTGDDGTMDSKYWWFYLTHWGLFTEVVYLFLSLLLTVLCQYKLNSLNQNDDNTNLKPNLLINILSRVVQLLHSVITIISVDIAILFWIFVYTPGGEISMLTFMVHGANALCMIIDFSTTRIPYHFLPACLASDVFALGYIIWSIVQYSAPYPIEGRLFIYPILDWSPACLSVTLPFVLALIFVILPGEAFGFMCLSRYREAPRLQAVRMDNAMDGIISSKLDQTPISTSNSPAKPQHQSQKDVDRERNEQVELMMKMRKQIMKDSEEATASASGKLGKNGGGGISSFSFDSKSLLNTLTPKHSRHVSYSNTNTAITTNSNSKNSDKKTKHKFNKISLSEIFSPKKMQAFKFTFSNEANTRATEVHV